MVSSLALRLNQTAEAVKGNSHQTSGDHRAGETLHPLGHIVQCQTLADTRKQADGQRIAQRAATADDADLVHRIGLRQQVAHQGMTAFVVRDGVLGLVVHHAALALGTGDDALHGLADLLLRDDLLVAARGQKRGLGSGITNEERELYREKLATLGLGLENRMTSKVGLLSGGQRQALTLLMATLVTPKLLLLDEHTAALDPKTADKVLQITEEIVARDNLTTLMVTHNMKNAIQYGNRLIMMDAGRVVVDIRGEEKKNLTVRDLLEKFNIESDRMLLSE